jgi:hypothetical protein
MDLASSSCCWLRSLSLRADSRARSMRCASASSLLICSHSQGVPQGFAGSVLDQLRHAGASVHGVSFHAGNFFGHWPAGCTARASWYSASRRCSSAPACRCCQSGGGRPRTRPAAATVCLDALPFSLVGMVKPAARRAVDACRPWRAPDPCTRRAEGRFQGTRTRLVPPAYEARRVAGRTGGLGGGVDAPGEGHGLPRGSAIRVSTMAARW